MRGVASCESRCVVAIFVPLPRLVFAVLLQHNAAKCIHLTSTSFLIGHSFNRSIGSGVSLQEGSDRERVQLMAGYGALHALSDSFGYESI